MLSLDFLISNKETTATKTHLIMKATRISQHIYFENVLNSKFKSKGMLLCGRGYASISTEYENL